MLQEDLEHPPFSNWVYNRPSNRSYEGMSYLLEARATDRPRADAAIKAYFAFDPQRDTQDVVRFKECLQGQMGAAWWALMARYLPGPLLQVRLPAHTLVPVRDGVEVTFPCFWLRYDPGYRQKLKEFIAITGEPLTVTPDGFRLAELPDYLGGDLAYRQMRDCFQGRVVVAAVSADRKILSRLDIFYGSQINLGFEYTRTLDTWTKVPTWAMPLVSFSDAKKVQKVLGYYTMEF